jgi:hypothetical protein
MIENDRQEVFYLLFFLEDCFVETISELIDRYGLEEDLEHIIIPLPDKSGYLKRCFLLKRRFIRIVYHEGYYIDYPIARVIEAIIRYPALLLSEALFLLYRELDMELPHVSSDEEQVQ